MLSQEIVNYGEGPSTKIPNDFSGIYFALDLKRIARVTNGVAEYMNTEESMTKTTYAELVNLRNVGKLRAGTFYRITDYVTTVANDTEVKSAGHPFDIILLATSPNTLQEECWAIENASYTTYFSGQNMNKWKVWYCLDNDTLRFQWADPINGKGVIYRLIDDKNNDCPYDFKNIMFKRYYADIKNMRYKDNSIYYSTYCGLLTTNLLNISVYTNNYMYVYTFGEIYNNNVYPNFTKDASLISFQSNIEIYFTHTVLDNTIKPYYVTTNKDGINYVTQALNNIVLIVNLSQNIPSTADLRCYNNKIGLNCFNITLTDGCYNNTIGDNSNNIYLFECYNNTIGDNCNKIEILFKSQNNIIGNVCSNIYIFKLCFFNVIGDNCYTILLLNDDAFNKFEANCNNIKTFGYFYKSTFLQNTAYIVVGKSTDTTSTKYFIYVYGVNFATIVQIYPTSNLKNIQFVGLSDNNTLNIKTF